MIKKYRTIYGNGESETFDRRSRFIGYTSYAGSEDEAMDFVNQIRKLNSDATHNVYAYRIQENVVLERQSDDGEPSGTSGMPILNVLRGEDLVNSVIVVTRYFGGTLLGTGGLVRAYGQSARTAIDNTILIDKRLYYLASISIEYTLSGKVEYEILENKNHIKDTIYTEDVEYHVYVEVDEKEEFTNFINNITSGNAVINYKEKIYGTVIDKKFIELEKLD